MEFVRTRIPEVMLIMPRVHGDDRGYFMETWQEQQFCLAGIDAHFVQDNQSHSAQWTLRGLHFQVRRTQGKLVRVTNGAVYDVAVDVRRGSPTFCQWVGAELTDANHHMLWIPPGFAHGFLVLSERADFVYKCTDFYSPQDERVVRWDDPAIGIQWPLPAGVSPRLAHRDASAPDIADVECMA